MPSTDTTYSLFNPPFREEEIGKCDSLCPVEKQNTDTAGMILCSPVEKSYLPGTRLSKEQHVHGSLIYIILFLVIFAFVRLRGKELFGNLLVILVKRKKVEVVLNEGISSNLVCYVLALLLAFSSIATGIVYLATGSFNLLPTLLISAGLVAYHFLLLGLVKLLGWTFNARHQAAEVIVNLWTYHIMGGLLISPMVIAIFFVQPFIAASLLNFMIFGLALFQVVKLIRWVEILFAYRVFILYMILYLCALEVMPLLVLYKLAA